MKKIILVALMSMSLFGGDQFMCKFHTKSFMANVKTINLKDSNGMDWHLEMALAKDDAVNVIVACDGLAPQLVSLARGFLKKYKGI